MEPQTLVKYVAGAVGLFIVIAAAASSTYVVDPGHRGVLVTLGRVSREFKPEGFGLKPPLISTVVPQLIRQRTAKMQADCYSSDLQQVRMDVRVLFRVPPSAVVNIFREYEGDPFDSLIRPRVAEALNEITALRTAEAIVQKREEVKSRALESARRKIGELLVVEDIVLEDITLTQSLEAAIEAKMVQEQEAARARFSQQQAQIEASTVVIKAKGEAESFQLRGSALRQNPAVLEFEVIERWDGITPLIIGSGVSGAQMMLPLGNSAAESVPNVNSSPRP